MCLEIGLLCVKLDRNERPTTQQIIEMLDEGHSQLHQEFRRGPWTVDEDLTLVHYVADHGEGRWNSVARTAGKAIFIRQYHTY